MLSRTADSLYWLARYVERADFLARILDATLRLAVAADRLWRRDQRMGERARHRRRRRGLLRRATTRPTSETVARLPGLRAGQPVLDPQLPRDRPRQRPRGAHRADHRDVGGDQRRLARAAAARRRPDLDREEFARFLDWVKEASLSFDGSAYRTMLRNDAYWFSRLGVDDRARRQHRPHPRREVPRAAAARRARSAAASTTSSGPRSCARSRR